ncbi:MAG: agmatine deiminase family protein [Bacteroidota bacterium]|nr:agmatine deiminase family protein [Bacteroidota bacterium]
MISDNQTNKVYFSELLKADSRFTETCNQITKILDSYDVSYEFLKKTKAIWARDYMPIQVSEDKFIEYRYDPDYLQGTEKGNRDSKTYPDIVCDWLNLKTIKTDIILDGGNVIKSKNCVILTDKIVTENQFWYDKTRLIEQLEVLFEVDHVVLIPWPKAEDYGHTDGMLRFIDEKTVLINEVEKTSKLEKGLKELGLNWEYIRYEVKNPNEDLNWAYINFLQTKDVILLPKLNIDEDEQAFEQLKMYYPDYARNNRIAQVDMTEIVKEGGALNCISWAIKSNR